MFFRMNLIYFTLVLHGVGALIPWNIIVTAKEVSFSVDLCVSKFSHSSLLGIYYLHSRNDKILFSVLCRLQTGIL